MNVCCIQEIHLNASNDEGLPLLSIPCLLDVTIKETFQFLGVYASNDCQERKAFFQQTNQFEIPSKWAVLVGDWNAILDRF